MKYSFQYYVEEFRKAIEDTGLITREEGEELVKRYKSDFLTRCERGEMVHMVLWKDMLSETDYRKAALDIDSRDVIIKYGVAYTLEPVFRDFN